ncbi:MAG: Fic family protein [Dehalococcoidia bacterium]|nr:Fic family protein [Dehalococcoidia bacterium]
MPALSDAEIDALEADNGLLQFDRLVELIEEAISAGRLNLTPAIVCELQRLAVQGLEPDAGQLRREAVSIGGSSHVPPASIDVERYLQQMCDYVNDRWGVATPEHLSAYVMWRLNWIHPFANGNGRTSRAVSYLVFCAKLGFLLPGERAIPEIIAQDKKPYYAALEAADRFWKTSPATLPLEEQIDVSAWKP